MTARPGPLPAPSADSRRRRLVIDAVIIAAVLLALVVGSFVARTIRSAGGGAAPVATVDQSAPAAADAVRADFVRFALNALLAPLLDDDAPPRWTDVALNLTCDPATAVEIDGRPMVPGERMPARAFTVRWSIDRCWPMGYSSIELSGVVELLVVHEVDGLGAVVMADRLRIAGATGTRTGGVPFAAALALPTTPGRE